MILVSDEQRAAIAEHGARDFPHECCGVMLGDVDGAARIVQELRALPNVHEDGHERRYLVSPHEMFLLLREERRTGRKVLGFYHSHPNHPAFPSEYDRDWATPWYIYIIISIMDGEPRDMTAWSLDEARQFQPVKIASSLSEDGVSKKDNS